MSQLSEKSFSNTCLKCPNSLSLPSAHHFLLILLVTVLYSYFLTLILFPIRLYPPREHKIVLLNWEFLAKSLEYILDYILEKKRQRVWGVNEYRSTDISKCSWSFLRHLGHCIFLACVYCMFFLMHVFILMCDAYLVWNSMRSSHYHKLYIYPYMGFPGGPGGKGTPCQCRRYKR